MDATLKLSVGRQCGDANAGVVHDLLATMERELMEDRGLRLGRYESCCRRVMTGLLLAAGLEEELRIKLER